MPKKITILGSTGSIGENTVKLILASPHDYEVQALTARNNAKLLAAQARALNAKLAVISDPKHYDELKTELQGSDIQVAAGTQGLIEAAAMNNDLVISAIVGIDGLVPTMAAIKSGANIALANKESLVCAGKLMLKEASIYNSKIIPVDSEHSAIFQVFDHKRVETIEKIVLTASGGPFRSLTTEQMHSVTVNQALSHPTWQMGAKITIDSATMMNKGLELIEAHYLFDMAEPNIEILIHPESIIHSLVCYIDGTTLAQLSMPDMKIPISYALNWPYRGISLSQKLDLAALGRLTFELPNTNKFPALAIAREVVKSGSSAAQIVMNSSNELAVAAFLNHQINFPSITAVISRALDNLAYLPEPENLDDVIAISNLAKTKSLELIDDIYAKQQIAANLR